MCGSAARMGPTAGHAAANVFGHSYPGAGATISQGLVFGYIIAKHAAEAR